MSKEKKSRDIKTIKYELIGVSIIVIILFIIAIVGLYTKGVQPDRSDVLVFGPDNIQAPYTAYILPEIVCSLNVLFIILLLCNDKFAWVVGIVTGIVILINGILAEDIISLVAGIGLLVESINYHKAYKNEK